MKNKLSDLNDHLFSQLERLNNENISNEELDKEVERSKAVIGVASKIIDNAKIVLDAHKTQLEYGASDKTLPKLLGQDQ